MLLACDLHVSTNVWQPGLLVPLHRHLEGRPTSSIAQPPRTSSPDSMTIAAANARERFMSSSVRQRSRFMADCAVSVRPKQFRPTILRFVHDAMPDAPIRMRVAATSLQARTGETDMVEFSWPFRLVRVDDDRHGGRQGLLRRGRGLGHAGRVDARYALYAVYRRRGPGQRADGPAGGREENGREAELDRICRRRRRGRYRRPHQAAWRRRARPTAGHPQHQPLFGRR